MKTWIAAASIATLLLYSACDDTTGVGADAAVADSSRPDGPQTGLDGTPDATLADSGPAGDAPTGKDASKPSYSAADVLAACTLFGSCIPDDGVNDCLRDLYDNGVEIDSAIPCLAQAASTGCSAVKTCLGLWYTVGAPCAPGMHGEICQGASELVSCDDSLAIHVDCQKLTGAGCNNNACGSGAACTTTGSSCQGDLVVECKNGQEHYELPPCAFYGLKCDQGDCVGPDEACTSPSCQGGVAAFCVNGRFKRLDCGALGPGFACKPTAGGVACRQDTQCDPSTSKKQESCNGDKLVVCHAGKTETVDCKALGFSGCGPTGCLP